MRVLAIRNPTCFQFLQHLRHFWRCWKLTHNIFIKETVYLFHNASWYVLFIRDESRLFKAEPKSRVASAGSFLSLNFLPYVLKIIFKGLNFFSHSFFAQNFNPVFSDTNIGIGSKSFDKFPLLNLFLSADKCIDKRTESFQIPLILWQQINHRIRIHKGFYQQLSE